MNRKLLATASEKTPMTAEVAVMNRVGVALAADSAVTIGQQANKIYTSADKLFQLCNNAPIGVMIYGNASLCGIPWETIIKSYRNRLGNTTFGTVEEYSSNLLSYLTCNHEMFPTEQEGEQVQILVAGCFIGMREKMRKCLDEEIKTKGSLTEAEIAPILKEIISKRLESIKSRREIDGLPPDKRERLSGQFLDAAREIRGEIFGSLPIPPDGMAELEQVAIELLVREYFGPMMCGLVVAGFGEREYMPSLVAYELEEVVLGHPRKRAFGRHSVQQEGACIMPFAQKDSVDHFLQGIDRSLANFLHESTRNLVAGAIELVLQKLQAADASIAAQLEPAIKPEVSDLLKRLFEQWSEAQQGYWQPVLGTVAALPKDELAAMGEALVNLTKFRRRVNPDRETVGGPIDVAVITKGDGFIWIRRKHYFDASLNPRVMARYRRES